MSEFIASLLARAIALHQQGQLANAEALYVQVLQADPQQFDALHLIGVIAQQRGDLQSALNFFGKALAVDQAQAKLHCNLGVCLHQMGRAQEALVCLDQALQLQSDYVLAWINRGNVLRSLQDFEGSIRSYEKAMELNIDTPDAYYQRGLTLQAMQLDTEALLDFEDSLRLQPNNAAIHFARGFSLQRAGHYPEAGDAYRESLRLRPQHAASYCNLAIIEKNLHKYKEALVLLDTAIGLQNKFANAHLQRGHVLRLLKREEEAALAFQTAGEHGIDPQQVAFLLASLGQHAVPPAAPVKYVRELFDQYAAHFDTHLQQLTYRVPEFLRTVLEKNLPQKIGHSLDLGCGTGLCGSFLRARSQHVTGVDISSAMLQQAAHNNFYDELVCEEIQRFLDQNQTSYELVLMADVLVYFGDLEHLFWSCKAQLQKGGYLVFSVELIGNHDDYHLQRSQRYAHSLAYLERLAQAQEWQVVRMDSEVGRTDGDQDIESLICLWRNI